MAAVVPTVKATRLADTHPVPTLAAAPSPTARKNGTSLRHGHGLAKGSASPVLGATVVGQRGKLSYGDR